MTILLQKLHGTSVGYFYDLGHAHVRETFDTLENFAFSLFEAYKKSEEGVYSGFASMTNDNQITERAWLTQLGFGDRCPVPARGMHFHTIDAKKFIELQAEYEPKLKEIRKAKLAELDDYIKKLREKEEREGRKPGELRVGDIVVYLNKPTTDLVERLRASKAKNSLCFLVTTVLNPTSVKFKAFDRRARREYGIEYYNYDYTDGGYPVDNLVLVEEYY